MGEDELYKKFTNYIRNPYENSQFFKGASDGAKYYVEQTLNIDNDYNRQMWPRRLVGAIAGLTGAAYGRMGRGARNALGGIGALAASTVPMRDGQGYAIIDPKRPVSDNVFYNIGRTFTPASYATGIGAMMRTSNPAHYAPFLVAPTLAYLANPEGYPAKRLAQYMQDGIDNDEQ